MPPNEFVLLFYVPDRLVELIRSYFVFTKNSIDLVEYDNELIIDLIMLNRTFPLNGAKYPEVISELV